MEVDVAEVLDALRPEAAASEPWLELREEPAGREAVRRTSPPPPLEEEKRSLPPDLDPAEPQLSEKPLALLRDRRAGWETLVEDASRRSFAFCRRNTWAAEILEEEMHFLESSTNWFVLRSKGGAVT